MDNNIVETLLPYLIISAKSIAVYFFIILAIRVFGKKELAQLSVVDLVFILLISNSVQNAMVGSNVSLSGGIIAALSLFMANYLLKLLFRYFPKFSKIVQGDKILLVHNGIVCIKGMNEAMMSMDELERAIREHGVASVKDVNLAILEVDGNVSILSNDFAQKSIQRRKKLQLMHNP
jgi:uncharacterized membrane protein YcaP (DUF421 family)